jgi:cell filamentation protein
VYDAVSDTYCYPNTTVLKNRAGLIKQSDLDAFEEEATAQRFTEPLPKGKLDIVHYQAIHQHIFQDVYPWAGKFRNVRISKGGNPFCFPENIDTQMKALFATLAKEDHFRGMKASEFATKAAHFLAELNAIHPFREGNGRSQLTFLTLLAANAGHPLNLDKLDPAAMLDAMIASFDSEETKLAALIRELVS